MDVNDKEADPFDSLLNLEDKYHAEGYSAGVTDGARAGRIEGRTFGLEKGFEKFVELGRLGGRAEFWNARLKSSHSAAPSPPDASAISGVQQGESGVAPLKSTERLKRQLERLIELTDPESLSTVNDEESVNAFDERLREAKAKATLVGKMVGEKDLNLDEGAGLASGRKKGGGEMEDFGGLKVPTAGNEKKAEGESLI